MNQLRAILFDAAGTLLQPARPVAEVYYETAKAFGGVRSLADVQDGLGSAMQAWVHLRSNDPTWTRYWHAVIQESTGVDSSDLTRSLYRHYDDPSAWTFAPGAEACVTACRQKNLKTAVVSNWDVRLRRLLALLGSNRNMFDAVIVSAEEPFEKPDPRMFLRACERLGVQPAEALMVGDSMAQDVVGARRAGCSAWHFGSSDCPDFATVTARVQDLER